MDFRRIAFGSAEYGMERALRDAVLRAPLGMRLDDEDPALESGHEHYGLFNGEGELVACVIAVTEGQGAGVAKVRQMAVAPDRQGAGYGREIMTRLEEELAGRGFVEVCLNARLVAEGFYAKLGYRRSGGEFVEVGLPHVRMVRGVPSDQ